MFGIIMHSRRRGKSCDCECHRCDKCSCRARRAEDWSMPKLILYMLIFGIVYGGFWMWVAYVERLQVH